MFQEISEGMYYPRGLLYGGHCEDTYSFIGVRLPALKKTTRYYPPWIKDVTDYWDLNIHFAVDNRSDSPRLRLSVWRELRRT